MNTKFKFIHVLYLVLVTVLSACGMNNDNSVNVSGTVTIDTGVPVSGPVFLLFTDTADFNAIKENPLDHVITMITVPGEGSYSADLTSRDVRRGDTLFITAFIDQNYDSGVPYPDAGDYIGFYVNSDTMQPSYTIGSVNTGVDISITRRIYDYEASIEGNITNDLTGDVILIAYSGSIDSFDISSLDMNNVMGYASLTKTGTTLSYSIDLMPFGRELPMEDIYIFALFDLNNNGIPDGGDALAFHGDTTTGIPLQIEINSGTTTGIDIERYFTMSNPSGFQMNIDGYFEHPVGYDSTSKPVFIMIAQTDNPAELFTDPLSVIKTFKRLDPGMSSFSIDLSSTDLVPGDEVMVLALWDLDNDGGFPNPTAADRVGYFQNTNIDTFAFTLVLTDTGTNSAYHQASGDWKFQLNKIMYDYRTTVEFQLDPASRPSGMVEGNSLICLVVHDDGVNSFPRDITDLNYVTGMARLPYVSDPAHHYSFSLFPALYENITDTGAMNSYIYVLYDRDGNGLPSDGDDIAAFWENNLSTLYITLPKKKLLTSDTNNFLSGADDGTKDPYGVRFIGSTY